MARQILTHNQNKKRKENIYFLSHKAFSRLQALKTSNLFEEGSYSPLRFPLSKRAKIFQLEPNNGKIRDTILKVRSGLQLRVQKSNIASKLATKRPHV